jgi:AcrR family transcriptional regulator
MSRSPNAYHHGGLRDALLEAAASVVESDGVDALSLRELARRLGVSHAAPAHHFADKAALLAEVAADGFTELAGALEAASRVGRTPAARLREVGRSYLRFALRRPGHYRVMFGRELRGLATSPRLAETGTRAYQALETAVAAAMPEARARAQERVADAAFLAWSSTHGAAMLLLDGPKLTSPLTDAAVAARIDRLTASVAAAIARGE